MQIAKTGLVFDARLLKHRSQRKHPEKPQRAQSIIHMLAEKYYTNHPKVQYMQAIDRLATEEQLKLAHKPKYIKHISNLWPKTSHRSDIMILDTYFNEESQMCSKIAVAGVLQGIDKIVKGEWENGFAVVRPPGHHSGGRNTINGFCIYNNVAIGAKYLVTKHKKQKVAILDWDVHHGDGTQYIVQDDKDILMISIHRYDRSTFYPASQDASVHNMGSGWAVGTKVNIPLDFVDQKFREYKFQSPGDNEYIYIYHRIVEPILKQFDPDFILVSSGFDAARGDPLGGFTVTPNGYYYITKKLLELQKPVLVVLEGGYNLSAISISASAVMKALLKEQGLPEQSTCKLQQRKLKNMCQIQTIMHDQIDNIVKVLSKEWKCLQGEQLKKYTEIIKSNKIREFGLVELQESSSSSWQSEQEEQKQQRELKQLQVLEKQSQITKVEQGQKHFISESEYKKQVQAHKTDIFENKAPVQTKKSKGRKGKNKQEVRKQSQISGSPVFFDELDIQGKNSSQNSAEKYHVTNQFYFAAGHVQRFKNFSPYNPKLYKLTYQQEIQFYETMTLQKKFTPKYYGRQGNYIIMENLLYEQIDPVVIDVKISKLSQSPFVAPEKLEAQKKKQMKSTTGKYLFKISGYTTPVYKEGGLTIKSEELIRKILKNAVNKENRQFYCNFLKQMSQTLEKLNRRYYSTSILIIKGPLKSEIRWVDFHYYIDAQGPDQNMITGINNLRKFIQQLQLNE